MKVIHIPTYQEQPAGRRFSIRMFALCGGLTALEGIDIYVVGAIITTLALQYGVTAADLAIVLSAQAFGQTLGSYVLAPLADRFGRRPVILLSVAGFGICTLLAGMAPSVMILAITRFLALAFVGAAQPNLFAAAGEFAPPSQRNRVLLLMGSIHALGAGAAALVAVSLLSISWQAPLLICGTLTIVAALAAFFMLPESLAYLVSRGDAGKPKLIATMKRIDPALDIDLSTRITTDETNREKASPKLLFTEARALMTMLIWIMACGSIPLLSTIGQWLPTFFHIYANASMETAAAMVSLSGITGAGWPIVLSFIQDRIGVAFGLAMNLILGALTMMSFAFISDHIWLGWFIGLGLGAFVAGSVSGVYALAAQAYPTRIRATGLGWAIGAGRTVAVIIPMIGGMALTSQASAQTIAIAAAAPLAIAGFAALALSAIQRKQPVAVGLRS